MFLHKIVGRPRLVQPFVPVKVRRLLADATRATWRERRTIARGLPVPFAASLLLSIATLMIRAGPPALVDLFRLVSVVPFAAFALTCHRAILYHHFPRLEPAASRAAALRFIGLIVLVSLVVSITPDPSPLLDATPVSRVLGWAAFGVLCAAIVYASFRSALLCPMLAVDIARNPWVSWDLTVGNGWRITLAVAIPSIFLAIFKVTIITGLLALVFLWVIPMEIEIVPLLPLARVVVVPFALLAYYATTAIEAAILSLLLVKLYGEKSAVTDQQGAATDTESAVLPSGR